jgi:vacuolar protein sorting-associated protein 54
MWSKRCRLLRDAEHFDSKLGKIDGAADTGQYLMGLVKDKSVAVEQPAPQPTAKEESEE